jgi:hypothetical protein
MIFTPASLGLEKTVEALEMFNKTLELKNVEKERKDFDGET